VTYDLGFLGGGQLARMSIMAAQRMGLRCLSLDPGEVTPASLIASSVVGALDEPAAIQRIMESCERVTLENEFIPANALREGLRLSGREEDCLLPGADCLEAIQDKLIQRQAYRAAGAPSPDAVPLTGDASDAIELIGFPMVLKARFGGYDGKGTRFARSLAELESHRHLWENGGWLAEIWIEFTRELACMVYKSADGERGGAFPTVETIQRDGVCDLVLPCTTFAANVAMEAVHALGGRGLFGVEMFETREGEILINEIAPRPHNSGHYTLDWGGASQFDQHVRVVMGYAPDTRGGQDCAMINLFGQPNAGDFRKGLEKATEDGVYVHWYGKAESRPGRKMGHINVVGDRLRSRAEEARERFYRAWCG